MSVLLPTSVAEAVGLLADDPGRDVLAGGTDFMVEVNYGHRRPADVVSLRRVADLDAWSIDGDTVTLGATVTHATLVREPDLARAVPALAQAARTVGSPQIRATGTIGGNLVTGSPAGDLLPVLVAAQASVTLASAAGTRTMPVESFLTGPKQTALAPGELLVSVQVPAATGPQEYLKVGVRNAMVIAVASVAVVVDPGARRVGAALGSCGPVPIRCVEAETWVVDHVDWDAARIDDPRTYEAFGARCAEASRPIDDHRSTAAYRRHAVAVLARRALTRCL